MCVEAQICRTWSRALSRFHVKKPWKLHVGLVNAASKPLWDPAGCQANANGTLQTSYEYETHICKCDGRFRIRPASWNKTKKSPKRHINRRHVGHVWTLLARFFWKYFWKPLKATFRTVNPRGLFGLAFILNPTFPPTVPPFSSFPLSFFILWKKPHHPLPHALVFIVSLSLSDLWSAAKCQTLSAFFFCSLFFLLSELEVWLTTTCLTTNHVTEIYSPNEITLHCRFLKYILIYRSRQWVQEKTFSKWTFNTVRVWVLRGGTSGVL